MIASLRAEVLKSRKRWANWILFAALVLLLVLFGYVVTYLVFTHPPRRFESAVPAAVLKRETFPENLIPNVLRSMTSFGAAIMIILGALSSASEYGWLTVQTILVQRPGRTAVLLGKMIDLAIITVLFSVAVLAAAALVSYVLVTTDGSTSNWPSTTILLKGLGALILQLAVWTAFGVFLGIAFRSTAAAIGSGLIYVLAIEGLVGQLFRQTEGVKEILKYLPGINAEAMNAAFPLTFANPAASAPLVSAGHGVVVLFVYLVVFVVLALLIFQRRDVSGG